MGLVIWVVLVLIIIIVAGWWWWRRPKSKPATLFRRSVVEKSRKECDRLEAKIGEYKAAAAKLQADLQGTDESNTDLSQFRQSAAFMAQAKVNLNRELDAVLSTKSHAALNQLVKVGRNYLSQLRPDTSKDV